jgi:hypothetical protein
MIYKLSFIGILVFLLCNSAFAQKKTKPDLYLYFQIDSSKRIYKSNVKSKVESRINKKIVTTEDYDIYNYSYITADGKTERIYKLFSSLDKNNYCVSDSSIFKKHKILPYKDLEKIKGLISSEWNSKIFAYKKVFVVEKITENQYKAVQVQLYFPFDSHGFMSRPFGSKEIIEQP